MDRRTFLCAAGTATGAAIAGCLDAADGADADSGAYDSVSKWAIPEEERDLPAHGYTVLTTSPSRYRQVVDESELDASWRRMDTSRFLEHVDPADLESIVEVSPGEALAGRAYRVVVGSFDEAAVRDRLAEAGTTAGSYEGFDLYSGIENSPDAAYSMERAFAVGDQTVVRSGLTDDTGDAAGGVDDLYRVLDAASGTLDSVVDQDDALGTVASRLEPGATSLLRRQDPDRETNVSRATNSSGATTSSRWRFEGVEAQGVSGTIDGDSTELDELFLFEEADAAERAPFDEYVAERRSADGVDTVRYTVDGRRVTVTSTGSVETIVQS